jgi:hypothetical protein
VQITTPSGYVVEFLEDSELTYGDRRAIQKAMVKSVKVDAKNSKFDLTGEVLYDAQEATLKIILKSIKKPDGTLVVGDLYAEVMSWKNQEDGDAVFQVVTDSMAKSPKGTAQ